MLRLTFILFLLFGAVFGAASAYAAEAAPLSAAYRLSVSDAEAAAAAALAERGAGTRVHAAILGARSAVLYEGPRPITPRLSGITFDKSTGRWSANLMVMQDEQVLTAMPVSGRFQEIMQLPVLKRQVRNGEVIAQGDIDMLDFPIARTRADVVTDAAQLIGFSPRGVISPRRPVRGTEIASPAIIRKGALVQMRLKTGAMEITTGGQAVTGGAKGDIIEVRNVTSKAVLRARVEDAQTVSVGETAPTRELAGEPNALNH